MYSLPILVVALAAPCGNGAEELLARKCGTDFDRHADDETTTGGDELPQVIQNADTLSVDAVLQHLHARNDVISALVQRAAEIGGTNECQTGQIRQPPTALGQLVDIDVGSHGFGEAAMRQGHERAVTAAVVQKTATRRG